MSKKNKADNTIKADGPQTTEDENNAAMAPGIPLDDVADEADTDQGQRVTVTPGDDTKPAERTRSIVASEWLAQRLRVECEQAKLDSLADELGRNIAAEGKTRHPIRIGGGLYRAHKARDTKTYTLVEYVAPKTIEAL